MLKRIFFVFLSISLLYSCSNSNNANKSNSVSKVTEEIRLDRKKRPYAIDNGKFFDKNGKRYLYGGENDAQHFDVTGYTLKDGQFHYGIGREAFPALIKPDFISKDQANHVFDDTAKFLLLDMEGVVKAYSIQDLIRHEVVNDEVNGKPVMAAYCILADLGAIYDREINGLKFTFGLSGYTYYDDNVWDGMDGFVMWDRETESLWWPLIGKAVSGKMKGTSMKVLEEQFWSQTTWKAIKEKYDKVEVLKPGQDFERPTSWKKYSDIEMKSDSINGVAPRWGENN